VWCSLEGTVARSKERCSISTLGREPIRVLLCPSVSFRVQHETPGRLTLLADASGRPGRAAGGDGGVRRLTLARLQEIQDVLSHPRDLDARHQERTARIAPQTLSPTQTAVGASRTRGTRGTRGTSWW
jgi:hypothetical protein